MKSTISLTYSSKTRINNVIKWDRGLFNSRWQVKHFSNPWLTHVHITAQDMLESERVTEWVISCTNPMAQLFGDQGSLITTLSWVSMTLCYFPLYPMSKCVGSSTGQLLFCKFASQYFCFTSHLCIMCTVQSLRLRRHYSMLSYPNTWWWFCYRVSIVNSNFEIFTISLPVKLPRRIWVKPIND